MKKKSVNLVTGVAVLVVLSGAYVGVKTYVAKQEEKENESEEEEKTEVFSASSDDIKSVRFLIEKKEVTFEKNDDGEWVKSDETGFPVNQDVLTEAVGSLNEVEADRVLEDVESDSEYGLDSPTNTITITTEEGDETVLHIGSENESTSQYYIDVESSSDEESDSDEETGTTVYVVDASTFDPFMKNLYDYAQSGTFPTVTSSDINKVTVEEESDETSYSLVKDSDTSLWNVEDTDGSEKADSAKVSSLTSSISSAAYASFVNYNCTDLAEYGLDKPYATITIDYQEEVEVTEDEDAETEDTEETADEDADAADADTEEASDDESNTEEAEADTDTDTVDTDADTDTEEAEDEITTEMVDREMVILVGDDAGDDSRYVEVNGSGEIYTMSNDTLSVLIDKGKADFWDMTVSYLSVNNLGSLQVDYNGASHRVEVVRETEESDDDEDDSDSTATVTLSYKLDGKDVESTDFTTFYNKLINMAGQKRLTEAFESETDPEMTVVMTDTDGDKTEVAYYAYDTNFYAAVTGDKVFLVNKMTVKELFESYADLVGEETAETEDTEAEAAETETADAEATEDTETEGEADTSTDEAADEDADAEETTGADGTEDAAGTEDTEAETSAE